MRIRPTDVRPDELLAACTALDAGARAAQSVGPAEPLRLRLAGLELALTLGGAWGAAPLPDAVSHLVVPPGHAPRSPDLELVTWDTASTGLAPPPLPPPGAYRAAGLGLHLVVHPDPWRAKAIDLDARRAVAWCEDSSRLSGSQRHRPFTTILARWLPSRGRSFLHAAAVGDPDGAVLLVGDGGAGKSTTTLACAQRGIGVLGDDFCAVELGARPVVHAVYRSVKLRSDSARRLVPGPLPGSDGAEACLLLDPSAMVACAPVVAVVTPTTGTTAPERIPAAAIRAALLPTGLLAGAGGDTTLRPWMRTIHALATGVPAYTLPLTWDLDRVADAVDRVRREAMRGVTP